MLLNIRISLTILFPPLVGAKYTKLVLPSATFGLTERHSAYHLKSLVIPDYLCSCSMRPVGKPQYSRVVGSYDLIPTKRTICMTSEYLSFASNLAASIAG